MKKQSLVLGALAFVISVAIFACGGGASTEQTPAATEQPAAPAATEQPAAPAADSTAAQPGGGAEK